MTTRSSPACSATLTAVTFALPAVPPLTSAHLKAGRLEPGGVGGVTDGGVILAADAAWPGVVVVPATGVVAAIGLPSPHEARLTHKARAAAGRTGQWDFPAPLRPRPGGG